MTPDEKAKSFGIDLTDYKAPTNHAPASHIGSALGFVSLRVGFVVEIKAIFEIIDGD